ncbi:MAG TPA: tripartite tricarboxylate transporter substrate binding protein [Burkholderiales bacterium]|nr:tripartite tricarboxylate transporter substrate binding protein [Burkholderiales bacterium]
MRFLLCFLLAATAAHAQYPTKPVRIVVGYAAGSSTDIVGRVMADRLAAFWKQSVYVETHAGAAGNLAADTVAKAPGDGYTLLFAQNGLAISAAALPNLPYSAERDLVALAPVAATPHILIVAPGFPAKNVQELIARARAEPGKLTYASSGVGNSDHLCGELFNVMAGIEAVHVPYKGGAPAAVDVLGGRISYYFAGMPVGLPLAKSGKARALAVTSKERFPGAPDLPTVAEQGLPDYSAALWNGFFAPSSVPAELSARIAADIEKVMMLHETQEKLAGASVTIWAGNQADFKRFFATEIVKWRDVVKKANLKLE